MLRENLDDFFELGGITSVCHYLAEEPISMDQLHLKTSSLKNEFDTGTIL